MRRFAHRDLYRLGGVDYAAAAQFDAGHDLIVQGGLRPLQQSGANHASAAVENEHFSVALGPPQCAGLYSPLPCQRSLAWGYSE